MASGTMTARIEALSLQFLDRCADDRRVLHRQLCGPDALPLADLTTIVHRMAGAAGAFGFLQLSSLAQRLDHELSAGKPLAREHLQALIDELACLERNWMVGSAANGSLPPPSSKAPPRQEQDQTEQKRAVGLP